MTAANAAQTQATPASTDAAQNAQQADAGQTADNYTPPATQADLDRIVSERLARQKAQFKDYDQFKAAAEELAQIKAANQTEAERLSQDLSRWQSEAETWRKAAVGNQIAALAATDFADPTDAITALAEGQYLDAGGQIDVEAIKRDLADVLDRKPHWRKPDGTPAGPRPPAPNPGQGSGGGRPAADPATEFASIIQGQLRS